MNSEVNDLLIFGENNDLLWSYDYKLKLDAAALISNSSDLNGSFKQDLTMSTGKKSKKFSIAQKHNQKSSITQAEWEAKFELFWNDDLIQYSAEEDLIDE